MLSESKTQRDLSDLVVQRIDGAFTKPYALETLYLVKGHVADQSQSYIVIYDKTIPIAKYKSEALGVLKLAHLNGDGQNEMFITSGSTSGCTDKSLTLN